MTLPLARQYKVRKSPTPPPRVDSPPESPSPPPPMGFIEDQLPSAPSLEIIELSPGMVVQCVKFLWPKF